MNIERLKTVCTADEEGFKKVFSSSVISVGVDRWYIHLQRGGNVLGVAHLDIARDLDRRPFRAVHTERGVAIVNANLDDRLGVYALLDDLPRRGVNLDILLTTDEEIGLSTAQEFAETIQTNHRYNWIVEFDRRGTLPVLYRYDDPVWRSAVEKHTAVAEGTFSDISYMESLGVKAVNWGVGYQKEHTPDSFVLVDDYERCLNSFLSFWNEFKDVRFGHTPTPRQSRYRWWEEDVWIAPKLNPQIQKKVCRICGESGALFSVNKNDWSYPVCQSCGKLRYRGRVLYPLTRAEMDEYHSEDRCDWCGGRGRVDYVNLYGVVQKVCKKCQNE